MVWRGAKSRAAWHNKELETDKILDYTQNQGNSPDDWEKEHRKDQKEQQLNI